MSERAEAVTILGAGNWGTTLACILGDKEIPVRLWDRDPERALRTEMDRENPTYLPGHQIPISVSVGSDLSTLLLGAKIVLLVIPTPSIRGVLRENRHLFRKSQYFVSASKGIEHETGMRVTEILVDELGEDYADRVGVLSGPNLAPEILARMPTSSVLAAPSGELCDHLQQSLSTDFFRIYTSRDVIGVEIGGAMKNIIAIASGIVDELELGDNSKGAMLTRGLAEITRLGVQLGARPMTFLGLSGMGDLVTTCSSRISRNHTVGRLIAQGLSLGEVRVRMKMVAEGINTTRSVMELARREAIEMPITEQIHQILFDGKDPRQAIRDLMMRELKSEEE